MLMQMDGWKCQFNVMNTHTLFLLPLVLSRLPRILSRLPPLTPNRYCCRDYPLLLPHVLSRLPPLIPITMPSRCLCPALSVPPSFLPRNESRWSRLLSRLPLP